MVHGGKSRFSEKAWRGCNQLKTKGTSEGILGQILAVFDSSKQNVEMAKSARELSGLKKYEKQALRN